MTVQDVLAAASQLSQEERLQVAIRLLESIRKSYSVHRKQTELELSSKVGLNSLSKGSVEFASSEDSDFQESPIDCQAEKSSLHDLLSQSPLSRLDFEAESSKSPVRVVEF